MALSATPAAERWAQIIDRQEESGLTVRAFAKANGLNHNTLAWWRWELRRTRVRRPKPSSAFVELVVCEPRQEPEAVQIALDGRAAKLIVEPHTDLDLVRRVLEALA